MTSPLSPVLLPASEFLQQDEITRKLSVILASLDIDIHGKLTMGEARGLFSKLLGIPVRSIPEDDAELLEFIQLDSDTQMQMLRQAMPVAIIEEIYAAIASPPPPVEPKVALEKLPIEEIITYEKARNDAAVAAAGETERDFQDELAVLEMKTEVWCTLQGDSKVTRIS